VCHRDREAREAFGEWDCDASGSNTPRFFSDEVQPSQSPINIVFGCVMVCDVISVPDNLPLPIIMSTPSHLARTVLRSLLHPTSPAADSH
jgi:hypothetical protein